MFLASVCMLTMVSLPQSGLTAEHKLSGVSATIRTDNRAQLSGCGHIYRMLIKQLVTGLLH